MFDFLRNLTKSAEAKRLERLNAYLDGELSPRESSRFENELQEDEALRASLDELRWTKLNVQQLPRVRAPRNFTLDPAVYGERTPSSSWQLYPALRVATALTAFFFIVAVATDLLTPAGALGQPVALLSGPQATQVREFEGETAAEGAGEDAQAETMAEPAEEPVEEEAMEEEAAETMMEAAEAEEEDGLAPEEAAAPTAADTPDDNVTDEAAQVAEEAAEEAGSEAPGPGALAATPAMTATEEVAALAEQATATATEEGERVAAATAEPRATELPAADTDTSPEEREPTPPPNTFPFLLVAEIVLGAGLLVLTLLTLSARRNR